MTRRITLLVDYKQEYFPPHKHTSTTMNLDRLGRRFLDRGFELRIIPFKDVDFRHDDWRGRLVLYQSSQDPGLHYRSYIEDVILGLKLQGAVLIPEYHLMRAHHNKVFMEILRDLSPLEEVKSLRSRSYGTYEDFVHDIDHIRFPAVIKGAYGDTSRAVALIRNGVEARLLARRLSRTVPGPGEVWKNVYRKVFTSGWELDSWHRGKFIVQEFVPDLDHDWKTVVFGPKLFVSVRPTRKGDFRASGSSGARTYPGETPEGLLDFIEKVFSSFQAPFASVDVLHDGRRFYLGEIQFVRFGTGPLIRNTHHFRRVDGEWIRVDGRCEWEREFAECIARYVDEVVVPSPD